MVDSEILLEVTQQAFEPNLCVPRSFRDKKLREHFQNDPNESNFTPVIVSLGEMKVTFLDRILSE